MERICAGIVTYNPNIELLKKNIDSLSRQVEFIYLVDNASVNYFEILNIKCENLFIIRFEENYGIAKALNRLCEEALLSGYRWILTMDQDSVLSSGTVKKLKKYISNSNVGIVCPAVFYEGLNKKLKGNSEYDFINACMTSASLTSLSAWENVDGFNESFFIDFVDNDFCIKLKISGYSIIRVNSTILYHNLGETKEISFLGLQYRYTHHSPFRYYYMVRNNIIFIIEYSKSINILKEIAKLFCIIGKSLLFENKKLETLYYILYGIRDGVKKKTGKFYK